MIGQEVRYAAYSDDIFDNRGLKKPVTTGFLNGSKEARTPDRSAENPVKSRVSAIPV